MDSPDVDRVCPTLTLGVGALDGSTVTVSRLPAPWPLAEPVLPSGSGTPTTNGGSVIRVTVAVWEVAWATVPASPPAATTGSPTSTPDDVPLSIVTAEAKLDEPTSMTSAGTCLMPCANGRSASWSN